MEQTAFFLAQQNIKRQANARHFQF